MNSEISPNLFSIPSTSSVDATTGTARNLKKVLLHPHPSTPFTSINDDKFQALKKLSEFFTASTTKAQKRETPLEQNAELNVTPRVPIPTNQSSHPSAPRVNIIPLDETILPPTRVETMHVACTQVPALIDPDKQDTAQHHH